MDSATLIAAFAAALVALFAGVVAPSYLNLRNALRDAKQDYNEKIEALKVLYQLQIQKLESELGQCEKERIAAILWRARYEERVHLLEKSAIEGRVTAIPDDEGVLRIVVTNVGMSKIFGYTRTELVGIAVEELIAEKDREHHLEKVRNHHLFKDSDFSRVLNGGMALKKDGTEFPVTVELQTVMLHGKPAWSAVITQD